MVVVQTPTLSDRLEPLVNDHRHADIAFSVHGVTYHAHRYAYCSSSYEWMC